MTNTATKTYLVGVIERAIAYYAVAAEDARTAAESWPEGEFWDRDDEALESEGPCNVRVEQPDGTWPQVPESQWKDPPAMASAVLSARFEIEHHPAENSDRVYVLVDGMYYVAIIRTDEGVVVDIYPKDGMEPVAGTYAFDFDVESEEEVYPLTEGDTYDRF